MWHRWDPHVHAPGTLLNDQFGGQDAWARYLSHLEASDPPIRSLGITDYYLTDAYERVRLEKDAGRLPSVDLIFPNVELRLAVGTLRGRAVNIHLLVSPEDPDHLKLLHEFLASIRFWAHEEVFPCTRDGLIRLGKTGGAEVSSEKAALERGASQFKVAFDDLREALKKSSWARSNILIAAASGEKDGTSGVREPADQTLREEIEAFADVIFASSTAQREYWLGEHPSMTADDIRRRYGSLKPCLHGSDAHRFSKVGEPDDHRYCWIKGELSFDTLRQACIDPVSRAFVGRAPPKSTAPSQILDRLRVSDASWAKTPELVLNPGLVAVIGARGSGKTALAEIVARACDAIPAPPDSDLPRRPSSSFLERAGDLLGDASVALTWEAGETTSRKLDGTDTQDRTFPRARYLSQDFVDSLCSSTTLTDELLREIERVIFEAHPILARDGALNFAELLEMRATRHRLARSREEQSILTLSDRVASEFNKRRLIDTLNDRVARTRRLIAAYSADRKRLVSRNSQHRVSRLTEVAAATEKVRAYVRYLRAQERALLALRDEVTDVRTKQGPRTVAPHARKAF